ncbi:hypothetical protein C8R48DRAFT_778691 [Suillus tomentosus]|nr:hypothetical protein C8R48DRAFT_778691 [Suillus tomentosus]
MDPWTCKFIPQLIPLLIFTHTTGALEELDDNSLFNQLALFPFGLYYCELTYEPLPFHSHFNNLSIHRLTTLTKFLTGVMALQLIWEFGLEKAAFYTTQPSAIYHDNTSMYNLHIP